MPRPVKNISIYIFTFLLLLILTGITTAAPQQEAIVTAFYDVSSSDANLVYINYMAKRGIISGFPDGSFHPSEGLTRAQAAVLVSKVSGQKAKPGNSSFSDIDSSHWAATYINSAAAAKYITGFPDGSFHPDEILTRAQGISLLLRLSEQSLIEAELPQLQDVDPNHWAAAAIATAIVAGIIDTENNSFKPEQAFNRGDLARSLSLLLTKAPDLNRQELIGQLIIKTGSVKLKRDGSEKTQPINTTTTVRAGDTLITANDGEAEINYPDGSGILLKPNSQGQALAQAEQTAASASSGSSGGGDKQTPDSFIDMETFLKMAIPYITFEQGEDPGYIAKKQGFIKDEPRGEVYRDDILFALLRMTYVPIPPDADLLQLAKEYGIISENDKTIQEENIKITANTALQMMANARNAWYERLEAEKPAEQLNLINYYISNSTYTYPQFEFSDDGQVLWYTVRGELKAINVSDASKSERVPSNGSPKEEYPAQDGESAINIYDNSQVLRAVSIEVAKRRNYVTDKYIIYRESPEKPWKRLIEFDLSLTRDYEIIGFNADNTKMIVKTNFYDNYASLFQVDPETMSRELIYHNPHADVAVELVSVLAGTPVVSLKNPETGELLTAIYIDDKTRLVCLREEMATIMDHVRADLGENHFPVAISPDFDYLVLLHRDDRDYGSYRLYNVESRKDTLLLSSDIPVKDVGHTYPVSFKTSDGQTVFGYLTLPLGKSPRNLPLIINVHGGPQARYVWTPNEYALLVSNLDIGVLSVDFHFSIGYGNEYTDSASKNMLLAQQDVFDSVNWAINNGIAAPECIGIMGHSYGGYISFYQAAVHPDVYKAVISLMGVWDWTDLGLELIEDDPVPDYHRCSAPEPGTELAQVLSPSSYADKLKSPILIIYAGQDDAVYPSQNIRAIKELTEVGNTPQVLYLPDSGHTPDTLENITAVFEEIKSFLTEQMKATM